MLMSGKHKITVDTTTVANGDSLAAYLADSAGNFLTSQTIQSIRRLDVNTASEWAEDAAHTSGDYGSFALAVRRDTRSSGVSADGDYASLNVNSSGDLYVHDFDAIALLTTIDADTSSIATDASTIASNTTTIAGDTTSIDNTLTALSKAEDSVHGSGDQGIMSLAVRNDAGTPLAADGDYIPLMVDANGALYTNTTINFSYDYAEDSGHSSGDVGAFVLGVRKDSFGADTSATGDYSALQTWSNGELKVVDIANGSILQQRVQVTDTATALPTSALANRKSIMVQNAGNSSIWIGSATVTSSGATLGVEVPKGGFMELECGPAVTVYAIAGTGSTVDTAVLEAA